VTEEPKLTITDTATKTFAHGDLIRIPTGHVATVNRMHYAGDENLRVECTDGTSWIAALCQPVRAVWAPDQTIGGGWTVFSEDGEPARSEQANPDGYRPIAYFPSKQHAQARADELNAA
jgi:hypothetical protein